MGYTFLCIFIEYAYYVRTQDWSPISRVRQNLGLSTYLLCEIGPRGFTLKNQNQEKPTAETLVKFLLEIV